MIVQPKVLWGPIQLVQAGGSPTALIYTAPALYSPVLITSVTFCNIDASSHFFNAYIVRSGGGISNSNAVIIDRSISTLQSLPGTELNGLVLNPGDSIFANSDAANVINCVGSGWSV